MRIPRILAVLILCGAANAARAAFTVPGFELVYSYPVETTLERPELRRAAEVWPEAIAAARKTIDIAQFYVAVSTKPEPIDAVFSALAAAGARGVKIRFLVQKSGATTPEGLDRLKAIPNLELRVIEWAKVNPAGSGIIHAKYMVFDGKTGYVGSQNFDWRSLKHIHEMGLLVSDESIVKGMRAIFEQDWKAQALAAAGKPVTPLAKKPQPAATDRRAYLVASPWSFDPPGVGDSQTELPRLIGTAQNEIAVTLLDYEPLSFSRPRRFYPPIDNALRDAAVRGVKVKLLVSHWNMEKPGIDHLKSLSLLPNVEIRIITIPEAAEGTIPFSRTVHSKFMTVDGKTLWLGTSNWSGGYLDDSRNLEVVVKDEALAKEAAAVHDQLWTSSYTEALDIGKDYPKPRK
ncbi:MAG: phospholipase D-like domain-containing protein [Elusimicrobia bacterium]|nr:phospholipase D-like domain-containing protein [Elusimicrobiota bacterium]